MPYTYEPTNLSDSDVRRISYEETRRALGDSSSLGSYAPGSVPLDAVRREVVVVRYTGSADYTISATSFAEVDGTNLAGTIRASGRPIKLTATLTAVACGSGGSLRSSFMWDGVEVTGVANGLHYTASQTPIGASFTTVIDQPRPGSRRFSLCAVRGVSDGTVYADATNGITLIAEEL